MAKLTKTRSSVVVLDEATIKEIVRVVNNHGVDRRKGMGQDFNDVDFAAGAMAVFDALGIFHLSPAMWTIGAMSGRDLFTEKIP